MTTPDPWAGNLAGGRPRGTPFENPADWSQAHVPSAQPLPNTPAPSAATQAPTPFRQTPEHESVLQGTNRVPKRALMWGIIACVTALIPVLQWFVLIPAIVAIQAGVASLMQRQPGRSMAIWGIVLGGLSLVIGIIAFFIWMGLMGLILGWGVSGV